ncbi:agc/ndr/ndr protein kinase [Fusarium flagelliforme]|uniref:non-specific serine/threonine protein kinase n=1 Tax=Fusarium flagelliforme TaxID=2675880 RepID=A0A395MI76_9HYPO|nr:agc/ndr/ndr protein kinase [Fusarium flagelliforme]
MAPALLKKASQQFIRLSSCDSKHALELSPDSEANGPDGLDARKHGNVGPKRWRKPFRSALKSLRISGRSVVEVSKDLNTPPGDQVRAIQLAKYAQQHGFAAKSPHTKELLRKFRPNPVAMTSNSTLVIRTPPARARSSLQPLNVTPLSDLSTPTCSEASAKPSSVPEESTAKTSVESSPSQQDRATADRRYNRRNPWTRSSPEGRALSTIPEAGVIQARPTIATVERASAAKIFLETHFNELLYKPNARALRFQSLEAQLCNCLLITPEDKERIRVQYRIQETCHLRELRTMKAHCIAHDWKDESGLSVNNYEPLQILGKGSFGVVRLVREKAAPGHAFPGQVYAMKVIRKSEMIRNSQEGHLRAERDFLVASEGSQWAVPLIASFQDPTSLYLVMEYMPGGDFLGLLIRHYILQEHIAQFYIAEMILAMEEAHRLNFIHRDIKPDNFLITASGHLKISDFGLAFDDHWSHDATYYSTHRYSLVRGLGINVAGDEIDQKTSKDILKQFEWYQSVMSGLDRHARYPVGNEDLRTLIGWRNRHGNRTAARSVVGTSQYMAPEVVRGHQPFVTEKCKDLIWQLIQDKDSRLCSRKYKMKYRGFEGSRYYCGRYVFPGDAEDIKAHRWFKNTQWDRLQSMPAPFTPHLKSDDDAHYFDESEPFEDWSESIPSGIYLNTEDVKELLFGFDAHVQEKAMGLIKVPFDAAKLRSMDRDIDAATDLQPKEKATLKQFVRFYGHKERKRPRDMLLRDKSTKKISLRIRKETAFMGYTWRRMRPGGYIEQTQPETPSVSEVQVAA